MKKQAFIVGILLISMFWPFAYAQPVKANPKPNFCDLGDIGVIDLSYDDVSAIQGIVTQDVMTSADNYKTLKAMKELGQTQETKASQIARRYRLYFVGPDGIIKYSDIVSNHFTSAQDWLLNTTIFGRVEYGGTMGEDLLVCPDVPTNEKGMCNYKTGDQIQDVYSKDWSVGVEVNVTNPQKAVEAAGAAYGQAYFTTVSDFVQMATDAHDPFGSVDVGMSRIRAHKYVVSLAAPAGSQLFIIPKTYMYFMSQLKNLAQFEAVAQAAFMIGGIVNVFKGLKSGGSFISNKRSVLEAPRDKLRNMISGFKKFVTGSSDDISSVKRLVNELDDLSDISITSTRATVKNTLLSVVGDDGLVKFADKELAPDLLKKVSKVSAKDRLMLDLLSGDVDDATELLKAAGVSNPDLTAKTLVSKYAGNFGELQAKLGVSDEGYTVLQNAWGELKNTDLYDLKKTTSKLKSDLAELESKLEKAKGKERVQLINEFRESHADELAKVLDAAKKEDLAWDLALSEQKSLLTRVGIYGEPGREELAAKLGAVISSEPEKTWAKWGFGRLALTTLEPENVNVILKARTIGLTGTFLRSYLKAIYYVGRPITALAWGLQTFSVLFAMNGYLELSPPGLTLAWDPQTTGDLFTKQAYIIIKGTPSNMPGMYSAGVLGSLGAQQLAEFLLSAGIDPVLAGKYSEFGQYLIFGYDFNPNAYQSILKVESEGKPTGITMVTKVGNGYLLRLANWKQTGISVLEDPTTMKEVGNQSYLTSVGMLTSGADLYSYIYGNPTQVKEQFPITWKFAEKLSDFGFLSQAVTTASIFYLWPAIPRLSAAIGAPLITGASKSISAGGKDLLTAKVSDMKEIENCVKSGNCTRRPCEEVCAQCQAELSAMSTYLIASGVAQTVMDYAGGPLLAPISFSLGMVDMIVLEGGIPLPGGGIKLFEGKLEKTDRCMKELLSCDERNFIIVAGQTIQNPDVLAAEQQEAMKIKGVPGLDQLPVEELLKPLTNMTSPINLDQEQLNVHGEFYNATGRVALRDIYYLHIIDATIDFLANAFPFHMCGLTDNGTISQCVDITGDTLRYANTTITSPLIPFKWVDTEMPAMVIPNTAVYVNISDSDCAVFSVSPDELEPAFNPQVVNKFDNLNFTDLERTFGNLRVINLDEGSIYPVTNVDGKLRLELDRNDGSYEETDGSVWLARSGTLIFRNLKNETRELHFRSAVFAGGTIVKKGNAIYILPRYFRPALSGVQWRQIIGPKLFKSLNGQSPIALDENGNILGIDARNTKIPGADKLGIITAVSGYKDLNGDGKIEDNEKAGWRFYKVGNKTYFDLFYNGKKETYDGSQVEVTPDGTVKIYQKDKPHTDAYLLRDISTRVDELGRTLMTIKDGQGNTLLKDALITWLKGTGGSIQYNPDTNNYVFVNGQPIELNNEFKTNGFNAVTGMPDPPLLQPSAVHNEKPWEKESKKPEMPPVVPTVPEQDLVWYVLAIVGGMVAVYIIGRKRVRQSL